MGKSRQLRLQDVRAIFTLLGECCELGADPIAWRQHMIERLTRLLGADIASYGEGQIAAKIGSPGWLQPLFTISYGWPSESDQTIHDRVFREGHVEVIPWMSAEHCRKFWRSRWGFTTIARPQVFTRLQWDRCEFYQQYARPAHCGEWIDATHVVNADHVRGLALFRRPGAGPFDGRCRNWLSLFMREHAQVLGTKLGLLPGPSMLQLPARLREVLVCLMEGDSEKQIALRLGISQHTVHYHTKELHRRFAVASRGELLARARPYWAALRGNGPAATMCVKLLEPPSTA